jgi:copper chaperone CopZ
MADAPTTQRITVEGMTCGHCVAAVREELVRLPGVTSVEVDLDSGAVEISAGAPLDPEVMAAAVEEAGYRVAAPLP